MNEDRMLWAKERNKYMKAHPVSLKGLTQAEIELLAIRGVDGLVRNLLVITNQDIKPGEAVVRARQAVKNIWVKYGKWPRIR